MSKKRKQIQPDVLEALNSFNENLNRVAEEVIFLSKLTESTLLIQIRLAYILERVSNRVFDLKEAPGEPNPERIEQQFVEIRQLLDKQLELMPERATNGE